MENTQPRLLIVEDEPDVCSSLQSFLGKRGLLVSTTASGEEAYAIISNSPPDLVILDLSLPDIDGKQLLKKIRAINQNLKVLIITGNLLTEDEINEILQFGVNEYLQKPILFDQLEEIVYSALGGDVSFEVTQQSLKGKFLTGESNSFQDQRHQILNLLGVARNKCESFYLNVEDGIYRDKTDMELKDMAIESMKDVVKTVDRITDILKKESR